tara:strand:- start:17 stop:562 length:546 start_codon:yes stop_codon:yes gene_type:complete
MQNYIKIYENVISKTFCENLIEKFESSKTQQLTWPKDKPFFTQINFSQSTDWTTESESLLNIFTDHIVKYKKDCEIDKNQWPTKYSLEPIRMKRYLPNDSDEFPPHVDVDASRNISRFLVFFLYLTTNEKGGTVFPSMSFDSPCKQGSLLMFPPAWPWLHQGMKPIIQSKYIVGSYLHYVN